MTPTSSLIYRLAAATLALALLSGSVAAQPESAFEPVRPKPVDRDWTFTPDPSLNCDSGPRAGPNPYAIGLPAALAAAERRELTIGGLGTTLTWADRAPDPSYQAVLRRIIEEYRCATGDVQLALHALESTGEPSETFVRYAEGWQRDDQLAVRAMNTLAVRGDSAVAPALREVAAEAPAHGPRGASLQMSFNFYLSGLLAWDQFRERTIDDQLTYAAYDATLSAAHGVVVRGVTGDSLSRLETYTTGYGSMIPRRALRLLAESHPTATAAAIQAYRDTARARVVARGVEPRHVSLFMETVARHPAELAFSAEQVANRVVTSLDKASDGLPILRPVVCVADHGGVLRGRASPPYPEGTLAAVFTYITRQVEPVRVEYGAENEVSVPPRYLAAPVKPVPPEVFFPDGSRTYSGLLRPRSFRVAFRPGESVRWTLLGQTVTATAETPRCEP